MVRFLPALLLGLLLLLAGPAQADVLDDGGAFEGAALLAAADVPDDFVEEKVFDDLIAPASIAFSPDGRVFVGQLDGVIKVFDSLEDTTPSVYADLSENVALHNDRGLMGMVLDPQFTTGRPYVYALYTYDAAIGGTAPRWNDNCPDPPGAERDGCVVSGRLSKILPDGTEEPLITDEWCQQYPSHSVGDLQFGPDGALYVTAGDGASYTFADYGQDGAPVNPCGDHAAAGRRRPDPADRRGRRAAQPGRAHDRRPDRARRRADPRRSRHRRPAAHQPRHGRPQRAPDRRLRLPQPVPLRVPARARPTPTSATSAGSRGRSSTASRTPRRRSATTAGRATRAAGARAATTRSA